MSYQDLNPKGLPEAPLSPMEHGLMDGKSVAAPNAVYVSALDVIVYPFLKKEDQHLKNIEDREIYEFNVDKHVQRSGPDFSFGYGPGSTSYGASDYARGYSEGVAGFLRDQGFPYLEDMQRMGFLSLNIPGALAGFKEGLNWRVTSESRSAKQDSPREDGAITGIVVALFKNHGIAIAPIEAPATERDLQVLRMGSQGKSFTPLSGESLGVFKLQDVHRLGLRVWLKEMGIEDFDVMQIVGTNLDPFKLGLEGRAEDDPEVLKLADVFPKIDVQALLASLSSLSSREPKVSDYDLEKPKQGDRWIPEDKFFPDIINRRKTIHSSEFGKADNKPDRFHEVPLSTLFAEKPLVSRMEAYNLGVQAKAKIDASKNSGSSNS